MELLRVQVFWDLMLCWLESWPDLEQVLKTSDSLTVRV
jgi:hypothetical protein